MKGVTQVPTPHYLSTFKDSSQLSALRPPEFIKLWPLPPIIFINPRSSGWLFIVSNPHISPRSWAVPIPDIFPTSETLPLCPKDSDQNVRMRLPHPPPWGFIVFSLMRTWISLRACCPWAPLKRCLFPPTSPTLSGELGKCLPCFSSPLSRLCISPKIPALNPSCFSKTLAPSLPLLSFQNFFSLLS